MFNKTILTLFSVIYCVLITLSASSQCDSKDFQDYCIEDIDGFTYLRTYKLNIGKTQDDTLRREVISSNYYYFTKGMTYILTVCDEYGSGNLILTAYDPTGRLVVSSFNKRLNMYFSKIVFQCFSSGSYNIRLELKDRSITTCGISLIGFRR